jgi:hypothetical protein
MDVIAPKKLINIVLDATSVSTLQSCGRLYDFRMNRNFKHKDGKSESLEMGSIVHAYLENMYGSRINGINRKDAHGFGMIAAKAYSISAEVTNTSQEDIDFALRTCEEYDEFYLNDPWIPLEVEVVKSKIIYTDDEIRILWKGKLDLTADTAAGVYPVDHKTMKQRRDTISLNIQFTGQCFLMGTRTMFVNKIGFQKSLKPKDKFLRVPVNYSADRIAEFAEEIVPSWAYRLLSYHESEYWPPDFTHCENKYGFCQFKEVCDADRHMRGDIINMNFVVGEPWSI